MDQAAQENIGSSSNPLAAAVESTSGLSGAETSIDPTGIVTFSTPVTNITVTKFVSNARALLNAADARGRAYANEADEELKRKKSPY